MAEYRIHFKNHGIHYFATEYFHADDDNNAVNAMHRMHVPFIGRGLSVAWGPSRPRTPGRAPVINAWVVLSFPKGAPF